MSKGRTDIVVIKRSFGKNAIFTIHNMTDNKINYRLVDKELSESIHNDWNMNDYLTSKKYNCNNISLEPFQVIWVGPLND